MLQSASILLCTRFMQLPHPRALNCVCECTDCPGGKLGFPTVTRPSSCAHRSSYVSINLCTSKSSIRYLQLRLPTSRRKAGTAHSLDNAIYSVENPLTSLITGQPLDALLALTISIALPRTIIQRLPQPKHVREHLRTNTCL